MLSIIICSVSPQLLEALKQNIAQTVGLEYEIVAIDNREKHWPIAKVYNYGARLAKFPFLFFVHEDVKLLSYNWGNFIIQKLKEPDCGVVGFVGDKARFSCYSGWYQYCDETSVSYYYQRIKKEKSVFLVNNICLNHSFQEVVTLDGLGLFVRKEIWEKYPFDENLLTGFHCYDIDFSLQIVFSNYKNYVCCSNQLLIEHFSQGNFSDVNWFSTTFLLHEKWKKMLPIKTSDIEISDKKRYKCEEKASYAFLKQTLSSHCDISFKRIVLKSFLKRSFSLKHLRNCVSSIVKYIKYA